jgi:hypothetical protein
MAKIMISLIILLASCQWIATHPQEDAEAIQLIEQGTQEIYEYETKTLSPSPQQPNAIQGPIGPK